MTPAHIKPVNAKADTPIFDAIIAGAGPAGSVSASVLSKRGWRVLLVEKSAWPRAKPCGGCLNAAAVEMLRHAGLGDALLGAAGLDAMSLHIGRRSLQFPLPPGAALERRAFDARLVELAVAGGTTFWPKTLARLDPAAESAARRVHLTRDGVPVEVRARVVLACDGVRGTSLAGEPWARVTTSRPARLGFAATLNATPTPPGVLAMLVGRFGYVGLMRLSGGRTHLGAALWPQACNGRGGPRNVIAEILRECGHDPLPLEDAVFGGTGPLTVRREQVAGPRVLAIGDACGYVEPFTGEGIAWAIRGALAATRLLPERAADWRDDMRTAWQACFESEIRARQRWCWRLRALVGRPALARGCVALANCFPAGPAWLARRIGA